MVRFDWKLGLPQKEQHIGGKFGKKISPCFQIRNHTYLETLAYFFPDLPTMCCFSCGRSLQRVQCNNSCLRIQSNLAVRKNCCIEPFGEIFHKRNNTSMVNLKKKVSQRYQICTILYLETLAYLFPIFTTDVLLLLWKTYSKNSMQQFLLTNRFDWKKVPKWN